MSLDVFSSASHFARAIRAGEVSARELLEMVIAQIEQHNATLNAIVTLDVDGARKRAEEADDALARGEIWGTLHGVPFTLKDAHATAHMRSTIGFPVMDHIPQYDGTVAARLKAAGGILLGKTNVQLLLADALQSTNPIFGATNNPWNAAHTPGGSSGGAASAVASGMSAFDVGSDLAGSVRIPAHFCGVYGLKPTENRVSAYGFFPDPHNPPRSVRLMTSLGPIARHMNDLELVFSVIAGPDGHDSEVAPVPIDSAQARDLTGLRVVFAPSFGGLPVADAIRKALSQLASQLSDAGAIVEEAPLPEIDFTSDGANIGELISMMTGVFQPGAESVSLARYFEILHQRDHTINAWEQFFETWDVLLCPVSMTTAIPHVEPGTPLQIDGQEMPYWLGNAHAAVFNYSGHPALSMPYALDENGLPIGVQLVTKRWDEARLIGIGKAISQITGGFQPPAGF